VAGVWETGNGAARASGVYSISIFGWVGSAFFCRDTHCSKSHGQWHMLASQAKIIHVHVVVDSVYYSKVYI